MALGLGKGDHLWTSPITFVASANCALYCGATVDFVDIDPRTSNMSVEALRDKLLAAERAGTLPKIVIPVHFGGQPCDLEPIWQLSKKYGFSVVEDASHAIGATYRDDAIGNCRYSRITVFSFHPVKIITTGEGGMALTNDPDLARRMALLRSHGVTRETGEMVGANEGPWYYEQIDLGYNYRMTDLHAALGMSQLGRLDDYLGRRRRLADRYDEAFRRLPIRMLERDPQCASAWHLYVIRVSAQDQRRRKIFERLRSAGRGVNVHYIPVHLQPYYRKQGFRRGNFPAAEQYYSEAITLPLHARLTDRDQDKVIAEVRAAVDAFP